MTQHDPPQPAPEPFRGPLPGSSHRRVANLSSIIVGGVVVLGALLILSVVLSLINTARERGGHVTCAGRLMQIGTGLLMYNNDYRSYPRFGDSSNPNPTPADIAGTFFMLVRYSDLPVSVFTCPQTDATPDPANPATATNFIRQDHNSISYALTNPNRTTPGLRWGNNASADWAIAADGNYPMNDTNPNSANHGGDGQYVLYNDGHVDWCTNLMAGKLSNGRPDDITTETDDSLDTQLLPLKWP
jgi:hypothetical protein